MVAGAPSDEGPTRKPPSEGASMKIGLRQRLKHPFRGLVRSAALPSAALPGSGPALPGAAHASATDARSARISAAADAAVAAGVPGVVVYARRGNETTIVARGTDNLDTDRPMTTADRFRIG